MNCHQDDCPKPATWQPALCLRARKNGPTTVVRLVQVGACEEHRRSLDVSNFLSSEGFDKLTHVLREAGKPSPVRKHSALTWEPLAEDLP